MIETRATWITKAASELGVSELLTELPKAEATELRQRIEGTFLVPSYDWWWERMKSGRSYWSETPGWSPYNVLGAFSASGPVWLMPVYDDKGEVFRAAMPIAIDILRKSKFDEFALVADDLSWMLIVNHHDAVFGSGARAIEHLLALEQRAGGKGAPTPKPVAPPPPLLGRLQVLRYAIGVSPGFRQIGQRWSITIAICRAGDRDGVHLMWCDADWNVMEDTHCASMKEAERTAANTIPGTSIGWITMASE